MQIIMQWSPNVSLNKQEFDFDHEIMIMITLFDRIFFLICEATLCFEKLSIATPAKVVSRTLTLSPVVRVQFVALMRLIQSSFTTRFSFLQTYCTVAALIWLL